VPEYLKRGLSERSEEMEERESQVREILRRVREEGDKAVRYYSREYDRWDPPSFRVDDHTVAKAKDSLSREVIRSVEFASAQIRGFAELQLGTMREFEREVLPGVVLGHRHVPVASVGAYVPGRRYPLIISAQMSILTAKVAGARRLVACAPPFSEQGIDPGVLWSMHLAGVDEIYCVGGVQALAMMAFGTETVEPVAMLAGPGNSLVAEAKRQLFGKVGIDLIAGPTEILVIADESADPSIVAADLLGQAEHDIDAKPRFISLSKSFALATLDEIERQLETLPSAPVARASWARFGEVVIADDYAEAVQLANDYASEHVEVQTADDRYFLRGLENYGTLTLGEESTITFADKTVGTNHTLPTGGGARYSGGLWVGAFLKTLTYQRCTREGAMTIAGHAVRICEAEGMSGHAASVQMRIDKYS
jgi:sulfopropanediol 3-dehydrogenase